MHFLRYYNHRIIKRDLVNKFKYNKVEEVPGLERIILNFGCRNFNIQKFATTLLALEIITTKKATLTTAGSPNVLLKIQKGHPAGCKVVLEEKEAYSFLTRLLLEILPKLKNFSGFKLKKTTGSISFTLLSNQILLQEFEEQYPLFASLPNLDVHISSNSSTQKELLFMIKSLKLPVSEQN